MEAGERGGEARDGLVRYSQWGGAVRAQKMVREGQAQGSKSAGDPAVQ